MSRQARQLRVRGAIEAALNEQAGAERYRRMQLEARRGRAAPVELDESGMPVARHSPSFVSRVARLLNPD